jgi:hypothetical protein
MKVVLQVTELASLCLVEVELNVFILLCLVRPYSSRIARLILFLTLQIYALCVICVLEKCQNGLKALLRLITDYLLARCYTMTNKVS